MVSIAHPYPTSEFFKEGCPIVSVEMQGVERPGAGEIEKLKGAPDQQQPQRVLASLLEG